MGRISAWAGVAGPPGDRTREQVPTARVYPADPAFCFLKGFDTSSLETKPAVGPGLPRSKWRQVVSPCAVRYTRRGEDGGGALRCLRTAVGGRKGCCGLLQTQAALVLTVVKDLEPAQGMRVYIVTHMHT